MHSIPGPGSSSKGPEASLPPGMSPGAPVEISLAEVSGPAREVKVDEGTRPARIDSLLAATIQRGATDLHMVVGSKPRLRLAGDLRSVNTREVRPEDTAAIVKAIAPEHAQRKLEEHGTADFAVSIDSPKGRFRVNASNTSRGINIAFRKLAEKPIPFNQTGLPPLVKELIHRPRGLILVTGITGSGKSTTLAAMIEEINETEDNNILTIEDPIEYQFEHKRSIVQQQEIGSQIPSFDSALRAALRRDPDVIMVGEMRDLETVRVALTAAETGHLVLSTVHSQSAVGTINRIIDQFPKEEQEQVRVPLCEVLLGVVCQNLARRKDKDGLVLAYEFMYTTDAVRNLIRTSRTHMIENEIQTGHHMFGTQLLDAHLLKLASDGTIDVKEALRLANRPEAMKRVLGLT